MTPWRRTLLLRVQRRSLSRAQVWLAAADRLARLNESGFLSDRRAEQLMAELGECP